jgi:predicted ATPase
VIPESINPNLYVITGGPGAGKTTLLRELARRGYTCVPEVARKIIQEQVESGGDALPWADTAKYTALMLQRSVADFQTYRFAAAATFVDRGIPDVLGYAGIISLEQTPTGPNTVETIRQACQRCRYNPHVFIAPPWPEIYHADAERKQTYEDAVRVYEQLTEVYQGCGYQLFIMPKAPVEERANFVLAHL